MSKKILSVLSVVVVSFVTAGCAAPGLQRRVDELGRECEDLQRQKSQTESELHACKARCETLERNRAASPARAQAAQAPFDIPSELKGKVDIRRRGNDTVIDIPSDLFFASGSSVLNRESERTMAQVCDFIRRSHPSGMLRVEGHSDSDPIRRSKSKYHCNWELSFDRSHAVMHYLVDKAGFDPHRVVCESFGEFHPVDGQNKSRNRRVEIVIAR